MTQPLSTSSAVAGGAPVNPAEHPLLNRVADRAVPPAEPLFTPHGYIIQADGTTWALCVRYWHGAIIALLYPELAAAYRDDDGQPLEPMTHETEVEDVDVFAYQRFELAVHQQLPLIRVCGSRMLGPPSVDLPKVPCTPEQVQALIRVAVQQGWSHSTEVSTDEGDMSFGEVMNRANAGAAA